MASHGGVGGLVVYHKSHMTNQPINRLQRFFGRAGEVPSIFTFFVETFKNICIAYIMIPT